MSAFSQVLGTAAAGYGVLAALTVLMQARQMLTRRDSCEVSVRFLASYAGGYAMWLSYGLSIGSTPLIVADAVGLLCAGLTLAVALSLRGSLLRPATWARCKGTAISQEVQKSSTPIADVVIR
jgi:MtN3 and saliva related transmembrane protein